MRIIEMTDLLSGGENLRFRQRLNPALMDCQCRLPLFGGHGMAPCRQWLTCSESFATMLVPWSSQTLVPEYVAEMTEIDMEMFPCALRVAHRLPIRWALENGALRDRPQSLTLAVVLARRALAERLWFHIPGFMGCWPWMMSNLRCWAASGAN